jgi:hypothetical protein
MRRLDNNLPRAAIAAGIAQRFRSMHESLHMKLSDENSSGLNLCRLD